MAAKNPEKPRSCNLRTIKEMPSPIIPHPAMFNGQKIARLYHVDGVSVDSAAKNSKKRINVSTTATARKPDLFMRPLIPYQRLG